MAEFATIVKKECRFVSDTPDSVYPLTITYKTLSKKDIINSEYLKDSYYERALYFAEKAIIKIDNVFDEDGVVVTNATVHDLPIHIIKELATEIVIKSQVPDNFIDKLILNLDITFDKNLSKDTWKCEVCKQRGLDKVRNCGYLGGNSAEKNKFYSKDFVVEVNGNLYTYCPIYEVDKEILNSAFSCYEMFKNGLTPEEGGVYDQTEFFVTSSSVVSSKVSEYERKEMEKLKNKKG